MTEQITALARAMGAEGTEELLTALCRAAEDSLRSRLRAGVAPADCGTAFPVACALLALAALDAGGSVSSFTAGNVTIRRSGQAGQRQREAMALMGPYLTPSGFHFQGVPG